jgi:hypothetical protein
VTTPVTVELPHHLGQLAGVGRRVMVEVEVPVTQAAILGAVEAAYPMLRGTIRDAQTKLRRPFLRFFACQEDLSHCRPDEEVPEAVAAGREPFLIIAAIAGG